MRPQTGPRPRSRDSQEEGSDKLGQGDSLCHLFVPQFLSLRYGANRHPQKTAAKIK